MSVKLGDVPPAAGTQSRRVVASHSTYGEAERAVDYLSDNGIPVVASAWLVFEGVKSDARVW
jgi:hypothetical protein